MGISPELPGKSREASEMAYRKALLTTPPKEKANRRAEKKLSYVDARFSKAVLLFRSRHCDLRPLRELLRAEPPRESRYRPRVNLDESRHGISTSRLDVHHIPAPVFWIDVLDHAQTGHFNRDESRPSFPRGDLRANSEQNLVPNVHRLMVARDDK